MTERDLPQLHVGDHVVDRDDEDGATLVVISRSLLTAEQTEIADGDTVADYNPDYPADDEVVDVVYAGRTDRTLDTDGYPFPRSRLRRVAAVHDVDDEESEDRDPPPTGP